MPWKQGGGSTLELAVDPPGATLESGFGWRLSSAQIQENGPFSSFPGLERWILLLDGAGFELDFATQGRALLDEPLRPLRFSGDWPASAVLLEGPCSDLNLMVDPRRWRTRIQVLTGLAPRHLPLQANTTLLFLGRGSAAVPSLDLHLGMGHLLRIEAGLGNLFVAPGLAGASLVLMELDPL
jgi:hypothetical protein